MAFGNNAVLQDILGIQQLAGQATQQIDANKLKQQQQQFNSQAPQLLAAAGANENFSQLAGMGLAAGNTSAYESLLKQALTPKPQGEMPLGTEQATLIARALGVDTPQVVTAMSNLPLQQAQMLANQSRVSKDAQTNQSFKAEGLGLQRQGQERLARQELQQQMNTFGNDVKTAEKDIREQASALGTVKAALKTGSKPSQSIVENFLLRNVAGEKGPLSDSDRASFAAKSGFNTFTDAQNYFTGVPSSNWTDSQKQAFEELVGIAEQKAELSKDRQILDVLGKSELQLVASQNPRAQKEIEKYAKKYGFEKQDGQWGKKVSEKKVPMSSETPISEYISIARDPGLKAEIQEVIETYKGKVIPKNVMEMIKQEVLKESNGQ